jgi:DNA polymerase III epsilon subunit
MNPFDIEYVVFDVETTGLYPLTGDRIVEIAAIKIKGMKEVERFESFVNPQRDIPVEAQRINNITPSMIADSPTAEEILPKMVDFVAGSCLVAHNIKFDLDFFCYQLALLGSRLNDATPAIDTLKLSKAYAPHLKSHRLSQLALSFGIPFAETHRAMADVEITVKLFSRLLSIANDQGIKSFQDLTKQFSVAKPSFKIEKSQNQRLLFEI